MTAELKSLSASLTAPKLPDNLFTVTDIDAELSRVRDDESDFIAADFSRLICAETDFRLSVSETACSTDAALQPAIFPDALS